MRPVAAHHDETEEFPYEVVKKAQKIGLTPAAFLPEEYGGEGVDFLTQVMVNQKRPWGSARTAGCQHASGPPNPGLLASGAKGEKGGRAPGDETPDPPRTRG